MDYYYYNYQNDGGPWSNLSLLESNENKSRWLELEVSKDEEGAEALESPLSADRALRALGALLCALIIALTLVGNTLVIVVVSRFRRLRSVTNLLLASLATADITVALFVMPFLVVYDLERRWLFGSIPCHLWISCDVMCCTASILHLCVVALDRFWAIMQPLRYRSCVSRRRVALAIGSVWLCSATISFVPIFLGWYSDDPVPLNDPEMDDCTLRVNRIYAVVSSLTSFYLPLPVMFYVYFRILLVAERQSREIKQLEMSLHSSDQRVRRSLRRRSRQILTDTKAIRTLGIVMGVFCVCWLPFFLMYLIDAYCEECHIAYEARSAITWLGYFNSSFNPCIYAFLNKDFKEAFKRALCCKWDVKRESPAFDEISTTSRSMQRMDRLFLDTPYTPECRTPSLTPDNGLWSLNEIPGPNSNGSANATPTSTTVTICTTTGTTTTTSGNTLLPPPAHPRRSSLGDGSL